MFDSAEPRAPGGPKEARPLAVSPPVSVRSEREATRLIRLIDAIAIRIEVRGEQVENPARDVEPEGSAARDRSRSRSCKVQQQSPSAPNRFYADSSNALGPKPRNFRRAMDAFIN